MKIKRCLAGVLFLFCVLSVPVSAAEGVIQIQLPEALGECEVHYEVNEETYSSYADHTGTIYVEGLESGNYEIQLRETEQFVFMPMEIPVPMWDETKQKMSYDITVIPKYSKTEKAPGTGDMANPMLFALMGVSMLGVAVVLQIYKKKQ